MEPKTIKQERETTKEDSANEEAASELSASSLVQNSANQEHRSTRNKGVRTTETSRTVADPSGSQQVTLSASASSSASNSSAIGGTLADGKKALVTPSISPTQSQKYTYSTNGSFSPHSTVNGTPTSSPPALASPPNTTLLFQPHSSTHETQMGGTIAAGGVALTGTNGGINNGMRQLTKVRRFLTTLQQFASDINSDVGERVRSLILNLLSGAITVEEFHNALQEVTHFPLRPFVLPFLRSHLPLLIRELHTLARRAGMSVTQYISVQESNLLDATAGEPTDFFSSEVTNNKRKLESYLENGDSSASCPPAGANSTSGGVNMNGGTNGGSISPPPSKRTPIFSPPYPTLGLSPELILTSRDCRSSIGAHDDEWKNIHVMLTCILSMVEKTRRALTMLQQREDRETPSAGVRCSSSFSEGRSRSEYDAEIRRHATELVAHAIRSTEERVTEVKRKAEEAVMEVRKAAVVEVQRAVANAESKAQEMVNAERSRIEGLMREVARRESAGDQKVEATQACWNCGRKAQDTCSGCSVAKYCSPFCQHKDWDNHHKMCLPSFATAITPVNKTNCKVHKTQDITKTE